MRKSMIAALLLVFGGALCAQVPAAKSKAAPEKKTAPAVQPAPPAAQPKRAAKAEPVKTPAAKAAEQEAEESVVMIDSKIEAEDDNYTGAYNAEQEDRSVPGGIPSSYGQCKGVISEAGRSTLVFESPEDGAVSFIQITVGKTNIAWKLIARIPRSAD